ncbi:hypothetical protein NKI31_27790 [Mesorhizobium sp. M0659]|uniref:hypothetical protein n=1 Tax=Mesorhizobium sp. M0659 TaxID=2956980 RepID=UPI0033366DF5
MLDIERPYLFVTATKPLVGVTHDWADKPDNKRPIPEAAYSIKNFGRTPAIINEIRASLRLCNLPPTPHYHPGEINDVERVLGADDALSPAAFDRGGPITNNVLNELFLSDTHIGAGSLPYVSVWRDHLYERQRDHRPIRIYLPLLASRQYVPFAGHSRLHYRRRDVKKHKQNDDLSALDLLRSVKAASGGCKIATMFIFDIRSVRRFSLKQLGVLTFFVQEQGVTQLAYEAKAP